MLLSVVKLPGFVFCYYAPFFCCLLKYVVYIVLQFFSGISIFSICAVILHLRQSDKNFQDKFIVVLLYIFDQGQINPNLIPWTNNIVIQPTCVSNKVASTHEHTLYTVSWSSPCHMCNLCMVPRGLFENYTTAEYHMPQNVLTETGEINEFVESIFLN